MLKRTLIKASTAIFLIMIFASYQNFSNPNPDELVAKFPTNHPMPMDVYLRFPRGTTQRLNGDDPKTKTATVSSAKSIVATVPFAFRCSTFTAVVNYCHSLQSNHQAIPAEINVTAVDGIVNFTTCAQVASALALHQCQ